MPVLSPHRNSTSALTGSSYRSTFSTSDRPYYSTTSSYNPRITSYSERISSRSYADSDGRRFYARSGSITEDGITTRFKEELRDGSVRRDSITRDSIRENSILERRDSSLTRGDAISRLSALSVAETVAEMRNRYSPANYVPAIQRKNDNISRSKSINDIGLPPVERSDSKILKKKVNDGLNYNNCLSLLNTNNTNDNVELSEDDNGNRATVAEICKKFDTKSKFTTKSNPNQDSLLIEGNKVSENCFKKQDDGTQKIIKNKITSNRTNSLVRSTNKKIKTIGEENDQVSHDNIKKNDTKIDSTETKCNNKISNNSTKKSFDTISKSNLSSDISIENNGTEFRGTNRNSNNAQLENGSQEQNERNTTNHTNHYASYIYNKDYQRGDNQSDEDSGSTTTTDNNTSVTTDDSNDMDNHGRYYQHQQQQQQRSTQKDLSTSPRLNRVVGSSGVASTSNNHGSAGNSLRNSLERERYDDDRNYEKPLITNSIKQNGLNGLKNIGNTCFMNSVIQCLSNTKLLLEYVKKDAYINDINTSISSMKGALFKAFSHVIKELWSEDSSDRVVNTVALKSQIQRFAPRFMGYAQQDAQEFLRYLLEGLHEDVNRVVEKPKPLLTDIDEKLSDAEKASESWQRYLRMDNSKIVDIFVGQLKSTLRCTHCGHCSVTFDPFWDLSLPIPQRAGQLRLSQCLEYFTREEMMDGDEKPTCSKCKERRKCTKSFSIQKFPKILVIHLKRFSPTERFRGKLSVTVDFPLEGLDMRNYAADSPSECRYNLYAISNHSGTTYSGHYTAYCRHPYSLAWHEYNDSRVSTISAKSVVSGEAYVLFYELESQKSHL